ncbi:dihydroneopterin aldolase [Variovorax sp. CF079]|uniref:dihydroneopterin aldolase n=1 Tax=Variovorax sp. CF079 TaxID=1882774 RepID=UPI00087E676A|nr:dihydroneopterin aldolase [Variovorax sp. CF079]
MNTSLRPSIDHPSNVSLVSDTADATAPMDLIFIEGFNGETVIGIHESELHRPQPLLIDVYAGVPRAHACDTDCIGDTIDYSVVRERLHRLLVEHRLQLLEAFAEAIADILINEFRASWVRVKVVKPRKFDDVQSVGVQIERHAPTYRTSRSAHSATVLKFLASGMVPAKR